MKLTKIKDKQKMLKAAREKKHITYKRSPGRFSTPPNQLYNKYYRTSRGGHEKATTKIKNTKNDTAYR